MFESYVSIKDERKQRPRQGKVQLYTEKPGPEVTRQIHKAAKPAEPRPADGNINLMCKARHFIDAVARLPILVLVMSNKPVTHSSASSHSASSSIEHRLVHDQATSRGMDKCS